MDRRICNWSETIPRIEKALGFSLLEWQKAYLMDGTWVDFGRGMGKTTIYCVKLALEHKAPMNVERISEQLDEYHGSRYREWFRDYFLDIWEKLKNEGLSVVEITSKRARR